MNTFDKKLEEMSNQVLQWQKQHQNDLKMLAAKEQQLREFQEEMTTLKENLLADEKEVGMPPASQHLPGPPGMGRGPWEQAKDMSPCIMKQGWALGDHSSHLTPTVCLWKATEAVRRPQSRKCTSRFLNQATAQAPCRAHPDPPRSP